MNTEFAYKILPAAKLAHDGEGNDAAAFMKIALKVKEEYATKKYDKAHTGLIPFLAEQVKVKECHIQPISLEEYEIEHGNE